MSYFIFQKNSQDIQGTLYRIAENNSDLNLLNIDKKDYLIIEDSLDNFNAVKYGYKFAEKYDNDNKIVFIEHNEIYNNKESLLSYLYNVKYSIKNFLDNNKNHLQFNSWNNYYLQLDNLNTSSIIYPLNKSLEQYFNDLGQPSYNILQLP